MTEQEWKRCVDPQQMLNALQGKISLRKLRLFGVACCRHIEHLLPDPRSQRAMQSAEALADGLTTEADAEGAGAAAAEVDANDLDGIRPEIGWRAANAASHLLPLPGEMWKLTSVWEYVATAMEGEQLFREGGSPEVLDAWSEQSVESGRTMGWTTVQPDATLARLLHEIIGPSPFRPANLHPAWLTTNAVRLAHAMYEERAFDRLPLLADSLEEAGCSDADLLSHLRSPGPHVLGCWALDAVLGRS